MKNGTLYAGRLKKVYAKLKQSGGPATPDEPDDPVRRLAIGVLGVTCGDEVAERALERLRAVMVDWNEIRVSSPPEIHAAIGDQVPDGVKRSEALKLALQSVYERENRMSLDRLKTLGRREARQALEKMRGVDDYAAACVVLWSLGGHAIPVSDRLWEAMKTAELVHPEATRAEIQAFLERNISAAEAKDFCLAMRGFSLTTARAMSRSTAKPSSKGRALKRASK